MIECPYCEKDVEPVDDCYESNIPYEAECPHCHKTFIYYVEYWPSYTANIAPCLNGGEHDLQPINGYPKEFFENKLRCKYCQTEVSKAV